VAENMATNGDTLRDSAMKAVRHEVRRLAEEGRTVEEIDRAFIGAGLTELERDVAHLLATYEVRRGSGARTCARDYWEDIERGIGG
jgi:cytochrome c556